MNGECVYSRVDGKGICRCAPGFSGDSCEVKKSKPQLRATLTLTDNYDNNILSYDVNKFYLIPKLHFAVNGGWGDWGPRTKCTASCEGGSMTRTRVCDSPAPRSGGNDCLGSSQDVKICANYACSGTVENLFRL